MGSMDIVLVVIAACGLFVELIAGIMIITMVGALFNEDYKLWQRIIISIATIAILVGMIELFKVVYYCITEVFA